MNFKSFKIAQKTAFDAKGRRHTTGKVIQRLFNIDLYTYFAIVAVGEANGKSSTFTMNTRLHTHCAGSLCKHGVYRPVNPISGAPNDNFRSISVLKTI